MIKWMIHVYIPHLLVVYVWKLGDATLRRFGECQDISMETTTAQHGLAGPAWMVYMHEHELSFDKYAYMSTYYLFNYMQVIKDIIT